MPQERKLYNNQRVIRPIKVPTDKYHAPYATFNVAAQQKAMITLNGNAFKLYSYFSSFSPDYKETIMRQNIKNKTGLSKDAYIDAFNELRKKGYIQEDPSTELSEHYIFVEDGSEIK